MFIDANRMLKLGQCDRGEMGGGGGLLNLTPNFHLYRGLGEIRPSNHIVPLEIFFKAFLQQNKLSLILTLAC